MASHESLGFGGLLVLLLHMALSISPASGIGVNWGTQSTHPLPPSTIVRMLKDIGFQKVKLFDADATTLKALGKSGIQVMVGIPNDLLPTLANSVQAAQDWVAQNVSSHVSSNAVDIRYVAVGNEPFLGAYNGSYIGLTLPALENVQSALIKAGLAGQVKVTVPLNADVYQSSTNLPSDGDFRVYENVFDANHDTLVWALQKNGYGNLSIIVGEIGWPTDGDKNANPKYAQQFNQGFMSRVIAGKGTPMRSGPVDAYLFSLIDEDAKSIQPGNFERHWGLFYFDGQPKYPLRLGTTSSNGLVPATDVRYMAKKWCVMSPSANLDDPQVGPSVSYACSHADCTSLGFSIMIQSLPAAQGTASSLRLNVLVLRREYSAFQILNLQSGSQVLCQIGTG
ncbi:O-Glycosyl hydrolases family 17 protein isoform 2 [Theobroma cacao]|uniref:glucan endo-1,3-beta-D-glucosidase n=1 Tax=Theobroma cacao TaxID=3641 RepID=A0A061GI54_THECC|nr:O-Glycosyl hydrolases family 17 protein isoform 2 [Theobroma cacao]